MGRGGEKRPSVTEKGGRLIRVSSMGMVSEAVKSVEMLKDTGSEG